jgi:hypothetical protein
MAKKLVQAIASGKIVVKNVISGECVLSVAGKAHTLAPGATLDVGELVPAKDVLRTTNVETLISNGWLALV